MFIYRIVLSMIEMIVFLYKIGNVIRDFHCSICIYMFIVCHITVSKLKLLNYVIVIKIKYRNIKLPGIINAYQDEFFTFAENVTENSQLGVKYMSDANHIWRYGYPNEKNILGHDKIQILVHPFAWTKEGYDNYGNYQTLVREKYIELIDSIDKECKDFAEYRDSFLEPLD